ncbi:MAG: transglutaminase family protein [Piscinibacter sp.]|uniref:transglutaminase family protein n=1 Tax=Piscinibacter sp. TaxID=1903157 RepID=UPI0025856F9C|nr:transglutaminase family protein [Piscinibacter sp.]MCW5663359.1 transglutaminase family protein [Piscinibacter sp.]
MKLHIEHETHYEYSAPLQYALQHLCLTPQGSAHQEVLAWSLRAPAPLYAQRDGYGNLAHSWSLARQRHGRNLYRGSVCATGLVATHGSPWLEDAPGDPHPALYLRPTALTVADERLGALGRAHLAGMPDAAAVLRLAAAVRAAVRYEAGVTHVRTSAREALDQGAGVCQDQAHVFIAACRAAGVPARYVSGYFHSPRAAELASHAWADVCMDTTARRWLSVDITHDALMDERHVRLAVGPDYSACAPVRGVREGGGEESMRVRVLVREAEEQITLEP